MNVAYVIGLAATVVFSMSGVIAASRRELDVLGVLVFGSITAIGGGTLRDVILGNAVFWIVDFNYVWVAATTAIITFFLYRYVNYTYRMLLYLDAVGVALFCVLAVQSVLAQGYSQPVAVIMGVLTAIGGGVLRDLLVNQPNLLVKPELYATPILLGAILYVVTLNLAPDFTYSWLIAMGFIFLLRAAAIHWKLTMPHFLMIYPTADEETILEL